MWEVLLVQVLELSSLVTVSQWVGKGCFITTNAKGMALSPLAMQL